MDSFRCIHAARLLLDHQLRGLPASVAGELAPDVRKIIQDATLLAFEHIVEQALARDVHCVLISGDCFDPDDRGLRGPAALVRGIGRLAEHDIPVILQASHSELWSSWPAGLRFPPNTHRLGPGQAASVSIARQGKLLATIAVDDTAPLGHVCGAAVSAAMAGGTPAPQHDPPAGRRGWQIHLPAFHPLGSSATAGTIHLSDECSPAQGLEPDEIGPHGCLLIEIDAKGEPRQSFVPAAPVRWERLSVEVSPKTNRDDLLQEMASRLEQTRRQACEKVWLIAWNVTGAGPLFERLENRSFRDELLADVADLDPVPGVQIHTHTLRLSPDVPASRPILEGGPGSDAEGLANNLAAEFAMRLEDRFADPERAINACLAGWAQTGEPWQDKIESLFAELDAGQVAHDARRLATHWFAEPQSDEHVVGEQGELSL
jgi:hypothetical protein